MKTRLHPLTFAAGPAAMVLAPTTMLASSPAFAGKRPGGGGGGGGSTNTPTKPPTPTNFRVTAKTAYTISVAWDAASSGTDFNFYLSGAYNVTPAVLPATARSHTFTAL